MITKEKVYSRALISTALILFLILISPMASAFKTVANLTNIEVSDETQVTDSESDESCVTIYDEWISWMDNVSENCNINMYNTNTEENISIPINESSADISMYDDKIVWRDSNNENSSIWMCNLSTEKITQITTDKSASDPSIYGNQIAYTGSRNGESNIYIHDIANSTETKITSSGSASNPAIYGNKTVYTDTRNGKSNIYMHDISNSTETKITTSGSAFGPAIYDKMIVYTDSRSGNSNIYMYDLSTFTETQITTSGSALNPAIYGDQIVWTDNRNGNFDIYMYIISEENQVPELPVANFTSNVTTGYVPLYVQFTDLSENADAVSWDFGDETNSIEQNSTHTYFSTGTYTVNLTVTNSNGTDSKLATINVLKATPTVTWSNPADIIYGTALNSTQLNTSASVSGSFVYTPMEGTVLSTGTQMLHVDFTPEDAENYNTVSKDVTINVLKATPAIIWNNPPAIIYGTALSEIQLNASASVPGSFVYNPVYGAILGAGDQTLQTTFTPADSTNYTTAEGSVLLIVNKATPSIAWSKPADIVYGTPLSETQLNASASVPGTFVYTPMAETVLSAGTQALHVDFTPADAANFTTASKDVTINVLTPVQKIQQVTTNVQEIVTSGTLNKGQGNALIVKLNAATKNLNAGNTNAAINELNAFNNQIKAYIKSGKLFSREGQALIDEINSVTNVLSK